MTWQILNRKTGEPLCVYGKREGEFRLRGDAVLYANDKGLCATEWKIVEKEKEKK